jgi:hypothetical protein
MELKRNVFLEFGTLYAITLRKHCITCWFMTPIKKNVFDLTFYAQNTKILFFAALFFAATTQSCKKFKIMKNTTIILALFSAVNILLSCKNGSTEVDVKTVLASGKIEVLNGKGEKDTNNFDGVGCDSNIKDIAVLKKIIAESSLRAKNSLNYPLSFLPKSVKLTVIKEDSL